MGIRKKGRAKFEHSGRNFIWWVDNDTFIRVASDDKYFIVAYLMFDLATDVGQILAVHGREFRGLTKSDKRPVWFVVPDDVRNALSESMGAFVNALLTWCLEPTRELVRYQGTIPAIS